MRLGQKRQKTQYYGISLPTGLHLYQIPTGNNLPSENQANGNIKLGD